MKLFVLGATGGIGGAIVDQALERGHSVTAFVRSAQKLVRSDPRLNVIEGDPRNEAQLADAVRGHDAVLSSLGPRSLRAHGLLGTALAARSRQWAQRA
jgi:putative NADH-flavin reductase